jgi:hypothetical protein
VKATFFKGVVLGSVVSVSVVMASAAFSGTGVGAVFNLGKYNGVNRTTALGGRTNGKQLSVTNIANGSDSAGIGITVHSGKPPLVVNSSTKVDNLNADQLDGLDSSAFQRLAMYPIYRVFGSISSAQTVDTIGSSGLDVVLSCYNGSLVGLGFQNTGPNAGTINEMYSTGSGGPVVIENSIGSGGGVGFGTSGSHLAGQFIWTTTTGQFPSVTRYVVTLDIHEVNSGTGCVFTGTAQLATSHSKF